MNNELENLRNYLVKEYEIKKRLNSAYSKRAYARDLGVSPTVLTEFLKGERSLSFMNINKIFKYLNKSTNIKCSWCEKPKKNAKYIIAGPKRQFICDTCVDECNQIAKEKRILPA